VVEPGARERAAAGGDVTRPAHLPTAGAQRVRQTAPLRARRRRRAVRLVADEQQREARSAADQRAVGEQAAQLGEGDGEAGRVGRVDDVDDGVALAQVVAPQRTVATLPRPSVHRHTDLARLPSARKLPGIVANGKGSPCSITERRVPELIPVLGSQPAGA